MNHEHEDYRRIVRDEWMHADTVAAWRRWHAKIVVQQVNMRDALLAQAALQPGLRVLDLACGTGDPALEIACRVAPGGRVTATDLSADMLEVCRDNARAARVSNLECRTADAEALPFADATFDRVTSRLGMMYFVDAARALGEMRRVLVSGGVAALQVWGPAEESPYFLCAVGPFMSRLNPPPPPPDAPSPLRFAPAGKLAAALRAAGFTDVREDRRALLLPWPGPPDELWQHLYDVAIPLRPLFDGLPAPERARAVAESVAGYARYFDGQAVNVPASIVTVSGRTP